VHSWAALDQSVYSRTSLLTSWNHSCECWCDFNLSSMTRLMPHRVRKHGKPFKISPYSLNNRIKEEEKKRKKNTCYALILLWYKQQSNTFVPLFYLHVFISSLSKRQTWLLFILILWVSPIWRNKKYVWFRWPDPTYFFRPTLNFFPFEYENIDWIIYLICKKISKNIFEALM